MYIPMSHGVSLSCLDDEYSNMLLKELNSSLCIDRRLGKSREHDSTFSAEAVMRRETLFWPLPFPCAGTKRPICGYRAAPRIDRTRPRSAASLDASARLVTNPCACHPKPM